MESVHNNLVYFAAEYHTNNLFFFHPHLFFLFNKALLYNILKIYEHFGFLNSQSSVVDAAVKLAVWTFSFKDSPGGGAGVRGVPH